MDAGSSTPLIGIRGKCLNRPFVEAAVVALVVALAGCGEDEPAQPERPPQTAPEDQPGGAGDEEGAYSLALFTGEGGRITPAVVRVPAYISIRVELSSGDGRRYGLTFDGETISVGGGLGSVSTTIDALRPGGAVIGTPEGASNRVRIEATAEPGP